MWAIIHENCVSGHTHTIITKYHTKTRKNTRKNEILRFMLKKHDVNIKLSMGRHSRRIIQNISIQNDSKMS